MRGWFVPVLAGAVLIGVSLPARGVVVLSSDSTSATRNTVAPAVGSSEWTAWNLQGNWSNFLGTPIGPNSFITAAHIGGTAGDAFWFRAVPYTTTSYDDIAGTDLRVWHVAQTFPEYAKLYTGNADFTNASVLLIGKGTDVGSQVLVNSALRGWQWGTDDHQWSWGYTKVTSKINDTTAGWLLDYPFTAGNGILTGGDSGGGTFIMDTDGQWKLAGVNHSASGYFSYNSSGNPYFGASLFNMNGLYIGDPTNGFTLYTGTSPASGYSTRISNYAGQMSAWVPEPGTLSLVLVGAGALMLRRRR